MKVKKVVIVGADPDLINTIHMCLSAYLVPIGVHYLPGDSLPPSDIAIEPRLISGAANQNKKYLESLPRHIPVFDAAAFLRWSSHEDVEILAGAYGLRERDHFMRVLLYCKNKLQINRPVRHPAYMLDRLSFNGNGFVCAGYPGSGNMLVQNILQKLTCTLNTSNADDRVRDAAKIYALYYWSSLSNYIESQFYNHGFYKSHSAPTHAKYGSLYLDLDQSNEQSIMAGLPMGAHFWANPWTSSHEPPTDAAIDYFYRYGFRFIFVVRNPLDIIVSVAGKYTWAAKQRAAGWLIDNSHWFEDALKNVVYYYQQAKRNREKLVIVQYEDFLSRPIEAIHAFSKAIDITINDDTAASIWSDLSGASLSADSGHYWAPSEGKWQKYIPADYKKLIRNSGIIELAREFGYIIDLNCLSRIKESQKLEKVPENDILALEENRFNFCSGKAHSIFSDAVVVIEDKNIRVATYKKYEKPFRDLLESPVFSWLLDAAGSGSGSNFIAAQPASIPEKIKKMVGWRA